jgi:CRP-like cAMP-binding protein/GNAT superfamily N-acetyltransferase
MTILTRDAEEADAEGISEIFKATYGSDYAYPGFFDPTFIKKLIFSDDAVMVVAVDEESEKIVGTASVLEERGAHSDLVGEFGRLAVHPDGRGRGIGKSLMHARLERVQNRLHVGVLDARVTHPFSMQIATRHGFRPVGLLPGKTLTNKRENVALMAQYFGEALELRRNHPRIIPSVYQCAGLSLENCDLPIDLIVDEDAPAYPGGESFELGEFTAKGYSQLLRIERGRVKNREIFGSLKLHYGFFKIAAKNSRYISAKDGNRLLGAIGFTVDDYEKTVHIFELISLDDNVIRFLINTLLEQCENELGTQYVEIDISAYAPRMQRTFLELGFFPAAYVPARVFHEVERLDIVKFVKTYFTPSFTDDQVIDAVEPTARTVWKVFEKHTVHPLIMKGLQQSHLFHGLSEEQQEAVAGMSDTTKHSDNSTIFTNGTPSDSLYVVLQGRVAIYPNEDRKPVGFIESGECLGEVSALSGSPHSASARAAGDVLLAAISAPELINLIRRRPDIGVLLYKNLALGLGKKLGRTDTAFLHQEGSKEL